MAERRVPRIRFKGFEEDWEQRKLGEALSDLKDGTHGTHQDVKHGALLLSAKNIKDGKVQWDETDRKISNNEYRKICESFQLREGDVLLTIVGSIGECALLRQTDNVTFQRSVAFLRTDVTVKPEFLTSEIQSSMFQKELENRKSISAQPGIYLGDLKLIPISVPTEIEEQSHIASCITCLDSLISLHQRKLEKLKILKKAMLEKMFPQNGAKVPEIRFSGFTYDWEQRKLGDLVDVCSGRDYKHLSEGNIPVYGTGGYMLSVSEALSYDKDAIGIGRKGTIDKPYILKAPFWTVDTLFYVISREKIDLNFAFDIFQNIDWKKKDESTGVPSLSKTAINEIDVLVPQYDEQQALGEFFNGLDHLLSLHQRKLEKLRQIKKSMLERMFV